MRFELSLVVVFLALFMCITGCTNTDQIGNNAVPTPTVENTPIPTATLTPSQTAGVTPLPTSTSIPISTPTPKPTETPTSPDSSFAIIGLQVYTDKETYKARESMQITVNITTNADIENVTLKLKGVENSRNYSYLNIQSTENLTPGANIRNYGFQLPSCTSCSGLSYGTHNFTVTIIEGNNVLKSIEKTFEIVP